MTTTSQVEGRTPVEFSTVDTRIGPLALAARAGRLCMVAFADRPHAEVLGRGLSRRFGCAPVVEAEGAAGFAARIAAYLAGDLAALDAIEVDAGGSEFQRRVWAALRAIPVGETRSYADLARSVGVPSAVRAVARANALNPISIVVPCHRVIASDGTLAGYAGGVARKRQLLAHEGALGAELL